MESFAERLAQTFYTKGGSNMKVGKSYKYKIYGPIPRNEYTTANLGRSTAAALEYNPQADDTAYKQRLVKRQAMHPSGRKQIRGWARLWKANGWRAKSASLQDNFTDMGRCSGYARKNNHPL